MERRIVLAMLIGLAACAKPADRRVELDPLVEANVVGDLVIDAHPIGDDPGYQVTFARNKGFPRSIRYNQTELLGEQTTDCALETLVGTALFPGQVASGDIAKDPIANVEIDLDGPALVRTKMTYSIPYMCNGTMQHLTGTTTFVFFPFGRIGREDVVTAGEQGYTGPPNCTCASDSKFFFTSFWTFPVGTIPHAPNEDVIPESNYDTADACFEYQMAKTAVHWTDTRTRMITMFRNTLIRFVYDFEREVTTIAPAATGTVGSSLQLSPVQAACGMLLEPITTRDVRIAGRAAVLDVTGIYVDPGDTYDGTFKVETMTPLPPGFVVSLAGVHEHLRVIRGDTTGQYYVPQLDRRGDRTLVWLRDPLGPGENLEMAFE